jgi:uncharacterized protein YjbI with pentapeptide repeats
MGVYLTGVCLAGMNLMGVYLTGVHLMGMHLTGVHLMGAHLKLDGNEIAKHLHSGPIIIIYSYCIEL